MYNKTGILIPIYYVKGYIMPKQQMRENEKIQRVNN